MIVFSVWFLAVQKMIVQNIHTTERIKVQTDAATLWSQAMQMLYSHRNTSIMKWLPRNCALIKPVGDIDSEACQESFPTDGSRWLRLSMKTESEGVDGAGNYDPNPYVRIETEELWTFEENFDEFRLYAHTGELNGAELTRYNHDSAGGQPSHYARYLSFTWVIAPNGWTYDENYVLWVQSIVLVQKGAFTGKVAIEAMIGKILD